MGSRSLMFDVLHVSVSELEHGGNLIENPGFAPLGNVEVQHRISGNVSIVQIQSELPQIAEIRHRAF